MISTESLSLVKSGTDRLATAHAATTPSDFAGVVTGLLDEFSAASLEATPIAQT